MSVPPVDPAPVNGPWPFPNVVEDRDLRTAEYQPLVKAGSGEDGILQVEWDPISDCVRVSGPVVVNNPPHAPAP